MKILQVVHRFWPNLAGTEIYALHLSQALARRHNVLVYYRDHADRSPGFQAVDDRVAGLPVRRVSLNLTGLRRNPYRLFVSSFRNPEIERDFDGTLRRFRPDVVHFHHLMYLSGKLVDIAHQRGVPAVITLHDYWFKCNNSLLLRVTGELCHDNDEFRACADCAAGRQQRPGVRRWLTAQILRERDQLLRRALQRAQAVIAPSHFLKEQFVRDGYLPAASVQVIENGIDLAGVLPHGERAAGAAVKFAYIGSISPHKGLHVLVEAFNGVRGPAQLDIYGGLEANRPYAAELRQKIVHPGVCLRGAVSRPDIWRVLSETDVLVVPSLWYENSPVVIREAFAAGVPVVGSNLGGVAEKIRDGVSGLLVDPGDVHALRTALQKIVDDPGQIERMRQQIEAVSSVAANVRCVEDVYAVLAGSDGSEGEQ